MDLKHLFDSPDQFLFGFEDDLAAFVEMDREAYHRSIFTDRRLSPKSTAIEKVHCAALDAAREEAQPPTAGLCYIFHIAHCGSTLLARALDIKDANLVCREPMALRQLGVQAASSSGLLPEAWRRRLRLTWTLLNRRYTPSGPVIVKANVPVNFILTPLLELGPQQPAIFLHYPLAPYLLAILRSPTHRAWVEGVYREVQQGIERLTGARGVNESVAVVATRLWMAQMLLFSDALAAFPNAASLDADSLFNEPGPTLSASFAHLRLPQPPATIKAIVASELFTRYSKDPKQAFDNAQRLERQEMLRRELRGELDEARAWIDAHAEAARLPARLAKPLVGGGVDLLA